MNRLSIILSSCFLLICYGISAESILYGDKGRKKAVISGQISNKGYIRGGGIEHANVCLISGKDTLWSTTGHNGLFTFENITPGKISLKASLVGYKPVSGEYEVDSGENVIFLTMNEDREYLNAAKVSAEGELVKIKGDTTVFNTRLLTTMQGDNAEELFLQLPGASISGGKVMINGKRIKRTYINGVLIYGDDPSSALNSLLAEEVTSMKVYEETSIEDRKQGARHGRKDTVLDIETRDAIVSAIDIHAIASGGIDQTRRSDGALQHRYGAGVTGNFYSEMFLASVNAFADNIDRGSNMLNSITNATGGLNRYNERTYADVRVEKFWKNRLMGNSVRFNYTFDKDYTENNDKSVTDYFATDESPEIKYSDTNLSSFIKTSHYSDFGIHLNNDIIKTLDINSKFDYCDHRSADTWISENQIGDNLLKQNQQTHLHENTWQSITHVNWSGYGISKRITPMVNTVADIKHNNGNSWTTDTLASSFLKRELVSEMAGLSQRYSIMPTMNIILRNDDKMTSSLDFSYSYSYDEHKNLKTTMDYWGDGAPRIDNSNTFEYTYRTHSHLASARWTANTKTLSLSAGANFAINRLNDNKTIPDRYRTSKSYFSILPAIGFKIKKFDFTYTTDYILPSLEQIRYQMDDRNPLMLRIGNPDLKQSMVHKVLFQYNVITKKRQTWTILTNAEFVSNSIVAKSRYVDSQETIDIGYNYTVNPGSTLYTYRNADGALTISARAIWSARFNRLKSRISLFFGPSYKRVPMYVGGQAVMLSETSPFLRITPSINPAKWIRIHITSTSSLVHSTNNLKEKIALLFNQNIGTTVELKGPKITFANFNYLWNCYRFFRGTGTDTDIHNLNAVIGCRLLKNQMTISLSGHDLLNNGSIYSMTTGSNFLSQRWTPSYGRYFMLNISFRFNRLGNNVYSMGMKSDGSARIKDMQ